MGPRHAARRDGLFYVGLSVLVFISTQLPMLREMLREMLR